MLSVFTGGLSETSNKQVILNPFKRNIKINEYMNDDGGWGGRARTECPPLPQVNLHYVYRDEIGEIISSILLKGFQKLQITRLFSIPFIITQPEDHWSCIAHLSAEDMLKSAVIEEKKFKNIESE